MKKERTIIKNKRLGSRIFTLEKDNNGSFGDMVIDMSRTSIVIGVYNQQSKRKRELAFSWLKNKDLGTVYYIERSAGDNCSISIDSSKFNKPENLLEVRSVVRHELGMINDEFIQSVEEEETARKVAISIVQHPRVQNFINTVISTMNDLDPEVKTKLERNLTYQLLEQFMLVEEVDDFTPEYIKGIFDYHEIPRIDCDLPNEKEIGKGQYIKK